jgi:hypothetical protein
LTPFPGTDLYEEVKEEITSHNYDLYDSMHTLLPTKLSLSRFYGELSYLFIKCARFSKAGHLIGPDLMQKIAHTNKMIRKAHLHHTGSEVQRS